jgi:hypothetical protein
VPDQMRGSIRVGGTRRPFPSVPHRHRGSRKRLKRVRLRGHWSADVIVLLALMLLALLALLIGMPWLIAHPPEL